MGMGFAAMADFISPKMTLVGPAYSTEFGKMCAFLAAEDMQAMDLHDRWEKIQEISAVFIGVIRDPSR